MNKYSSFLLVLCILVGYSSFAADSTKLRKATLAWQALEEAAKYEVHLATNQRFDPVMKKQVLELPSWTVELGSGTYYFRVRPIDKKDLPGPWSDIEGFVVNPNGPELVEPAEAVLFREKFTKGTLKLEWTAGLKGTQSILEIKDAQGPVLKRSVESNSYRWKPQEAGTFQWRAGYQSIAGTEWSSYRTFTILPEALEQPEQAAPVRYVGAPTSLCQRVSPGGFQLGGIGAFQTSGGQSASGFLSWNPRCTVSPFLELSLSLGGTLFKASPSATALNASSNQMKIFEWVGWVTAVPSGKSLNLGLGAGAETWLNYGTYPLIGLRFGFRPGWARVPFFEEIFLEYGFLFSADKTHVAKGGLMMRWGGVK